MDRRNFSLSAVSAVVTGLTGCGGGGETASAAPEVVPVTPPVIAPVVAPVAPPVTTPGPELATTTALPPGTVFLQTVAATDGDGEAAPGQANYWDLTVAFSLSDGFNDQWDGAMELSTDDGVTVESFPSDQTFAELTAFGPDLGVDDGLKVVTFVGVNDARMHPVQGARLQQTLTLTTAVAPVSASWTANFDSGTFDFSDEPYFSQVVVRGTSGNLLATLYREDSTGTTGTNGSANLSAYAGQTVVLSFERNVPGNVGVVGRASVTDANATEYISNGDFAAGASGWTVPALRVSQNIQSGLRTLHHLEVRRMFYTRPNALWGRFTDTFRNPTVSAITVAVNFHSNLGSDGQGAIYDTPGAGGKALTSWDGGTGDRDVGLVHGSGATVTYTSITALPPTGGSDDINARHSITVPAGGTVTLVNFVIMTGSDTGQTATSLGVRATDVDVVAADIATNFRTKLIYQRGMMQVHLDTLKNF